MSWAFELCFVSFFAPTNYRFLTGLTLVVFLLAASVASAFHDHDQGHRSSETELLCSMCVHEDTPGSMSLASPLLLSEPECASLAGDSRYDIPRDCAGLVSLPRGPPADPDSLQRIAD